MVIDLIKDISPLGLQGRSEDEWLKISDEIKNQFKPETKPGRKSDFAYFWIKKIKEIKVSCETKISR